MRKLILINIVAILIISVFAGCSKDCCTAKQAAQDDAIEASGVLLSSFQPNGNSNYIYPDNFAGEWIDEGYLYIALTNDSRSNTKQYEDILSRYNCIKFVEVEYSLNQLELIKEYTAAELKNHSNLVCYYIDYKQNKIVLEFEELDYEYIENIIDEQLKSDNPFGLNKNVKITKDMFIIQEGEIATPE